MDAEAAAGMLRRAVAFSGARLIQSAFETAHGWHRLPGRSVILLQIAMNLLAEPERGQLELYGIPSGHPSYEPGPSDLPTFSTPSRSSRRRDTCYSDRSATRPSRPRPARSARPTRRALISSLALDLYNQLYIRPSSPDLGVLDGLARARAGVGIVRCQQRTGIVGPGWTVHRIDTDGRAVVENDGISFLGADYQSARRSGAIEAGERCSVWIANELRWMIPGFYFVIGDADGDECQHRGRFYWNLSPSIAVEFVSVATSLLNRWLIPFRAKVVSDPNAYARADSGVLYFARRDDSADCARDR